MRTKCALSLKLEIQKQKRGRDVSYDHRTKAADICLQYCGQDELRARLMEHIVDVAREPRRIVDERFMRGWAGSIV